MPARFESSSVSPAFRRHSLLWKGFQSSLWQAGLQYHTNLHLEQMSLAPEAPHVLHVPPFTDDMATPAARARDVESDMSSACRPLAIVRGPANKQEQAIIMLFASR